MICFDSLENRFFEVDAVHKVDHLYRANHYRLSLRLNFFNDAIDVSNIDGMRMVCFRKITKLMTQHNMWQNHHSFYVVDYEMRFIPRVAERIQQNDDESDRRDGDESENSNYVNSTSSSDDSSSGDSAYKSNTSVATDSSDSGHLSNSCAYSSDGDDRQ